MRVWEPIARFLRGSGESKLDHEAAAVTRLAREFKSRIADFEGRSDDPFSAMTKIMAVNHYEDRQEANIWRGDN